MTLLETAARYIYRDGWRKVLIGDDAGAESILDMWLGNEALIPDAVWEGLLADFELERQSREARRDQH